MPKEPAIRDRTPDAEARTKSVRVSGGWALVCVIGVLGLLYTVLLASPKDPFFPDEFAHYDYVASIVEGDGIPRQYSQARSETADAFACSPLSNVLPLTCGAQGQDPRALPWLGQNAATVNPPSYYVLTAGVASALREILGTDLLTSARFSSMLWTLSLCALAAVLALQLGASSKRAASLAIALGASPFILIQSVVVQTDAAGAAMAVLAVIVWLALRNRPPGLRLTASLLLAVVATTIRPQGLIAAVIIIALDFRASSPRPYRRAIVGSVAYLATVALIGIADAALRAGPPENGLLEAYVAENWNQRVVDTLVQAWLSSPLVLGWPFETNAVRPGGWLLAAGALLLCVFAVVFALKARGRYARVVGVGGFIGLFALPAILLATLVLRGQALFFQPRYLLTALVFCACAAVTVTSKGVDKWLPVLAGGMLTVASVGVLLTF